MKKSLLCLAVCSAMVLHVAADEQDEVVAAANDTQSTKLEVIKVSGEKQERTLKDTISSLSVIDEEKLRTTKYQTVTDTISEVPNIIAPSGAVPSIRGVTGDGAAGGFNGVTGGANARVSTLVDGVYQPFVAINTSDLGLWDVEQVEVYRGPQSTNNGRNSIGGAIYVRTKDPSFDWEGAVRLAYRNEEDFFDKALVLSGPVVEDKLAFRFSGQFLDGNTTSNNQEFATNPAGFDISGVDTLNGRLKLLWVPTDDLDVLFTYSKSDNDGDIGRRYFELADPYAFNKVFVRDTHSDTDTATLKLDYRFSNDISFDILLSHLDYNYAFRGYEAVPVRDQFVSIGEKNKSIDAKLNFGEMNPTLNGYVGVAYFEREQDIESTGRATYDGSDELDTKAVYGEVNFGLTERVTIAGGLRYQHETQNRQFSFPPRVPNSTLDQTNGIFLPKLALQYDITDQTRLALSARRGYNSAGGALDFFAAQYYFYDEETVNTYEFSTYSDLFDNKINLRTNIFYNDYDGYQAQNARRRVINVDEAVTYGAEIEALALVTRDLQLNLGLGLLKTEIKDGGVSFTDIDGNELNSAPKTTANAGATYYLTDNIDIGATVQYAGGSFGDVENMAGREVGGYTLIDLAANYETESWLVSAYINNLTDRKATRVREPGGAGFPPFADVVESRNMGIAVTYQFF